MGQTHTNEYFKYFLDSYVINSILEQQNINHELQKKVKFQIANIFFSDIFRKSIEV